MSAVGKEPHFSFFLFFSRGPLLDWFGQIMLFSHWLTQTWRSTNACVPATDKAVRFVLRVLLTIKLDKTFCPVFVPGPVRPAAVLKVIEYFRGGDKAPIRTTQ